MPTANTTYTCDYCSSTYLTEEQALQCEKDHFLLIPELSELLQLLQKKNANITFTWTKDHSAPKTICFTQGDKKFLYTYTGQPR